MSKSPLSLLFGILYSAHPFSAIMASTVVTILLWRLHVEVTSIIIATIVMLCLQLATGIINDLLDFEVDKIYQKHKPTVSDGIAKRHLITAVIVLIILSLSLSIRYFTLSTIFLVIIGFLFAQLYNIWLKDTPLSLFVFGVSFFIQLLFIFSIIDLSRIFEQSIQFFVIGAFLTSILHIANDLVDYEIDRARNARTFVVWLGKPRIYYLLATMVIIFSAISVSISNFLLIILLYLSMNSVLVLGMEYDMMMIRYISYYFTVVCAVIIFIFIPIS